MELRFKRKLSTNKFGYTYLAVPSEVVDALGCMHVNLVVGNGNRVYIEPISSS
jgi:hypothetical protein